MKSFQELNLCDDFLFKLVMHDEELVMGFLEMVLDLKGKIKGVKFIDEEKTIKVGYIDKSIRLDVYVLDDESNVYNIEIQNSRLRELPKRSRKYQSSIDMGALKPGEDYANLKKQYIIFVCTGDPFGRGLYKYTFTNRCQELDDLELGDGTAKIFLNTRGKMGEVSEALKAFLKFVEMSTVQNAKEVKDLYVAQLSEKIEDIKKNKELGGAFMTLEEQMEELARKKMAEGLIEGKAEGLAQGKAEGMLEEKINIARAMKNEGFALEQIAKITKLTKEEIEKL